MAREKERTGMGMNATELADDAVFSLAAADPDRTLCARFLPAPCRPAAWCVLAFHNEVVRALAPGRSGAVAGPMAGYIRLQWWRDVLEGTRGPEHELAPRLLALVEQRRVARQTLLRLVASAEAELAHRDEPDPSIAQWRAMLRDGAGAVQRAMGEILGVQDNNILLRLEACGMAYGAGALLRHGAVLGRAGRFLFPGPVEDLRREGQRLLAELAGPGLARSWRAAALPAVLARRDLARGGEHAGHPRGVGDRLAVMLAGMGLTRPF
ncbi:squalene/phytoene synthase family protein [Acetobacter sp. TBRC 12305]|uniref:Squalene/phytoene synthase family protein n=1 Tax=Acetobacter garciniae TaxID=2817435 RepID=A0A939HPS4_9PROT|nr:squalene/phytoene synthase family protein [Acetobacter garciniae]MBO1325949.1 squalene/phytoene synthase family protein [Acetobacter garciniae]MBX0345849.1 squalene/phytoene synthase family protein [Acetobacter garciniae]